MCHIKGCNKTLDQYRTTNSIFNYTSEFGERILFNENLFSNYPNHQAETSTINYRSPVSKERFIKLYKNPDEITGITISSANLRELPATQLKECVSLDFSYNQLKLFPNFRFIAPKLSTLALRRNPFYLSDIETERIFNEEIISKIPKTINNLFLEGTFYGSIKRGLIPDGLKDGSTNSQLTNFDCGRGSGAYFHQDTRLASDKIAAANSTNNEGNESFCPDMPATCVSFNISSNDFRSVDLESNGSVTGVTDSYSFKRLPNLINLYVGGNYHLDDFVGGVRLSSDLASANPGNTIVDINYDVTALSIPSNLSGCTTLKKYRQVHARGGAIPGRELVPPGTDSYKFSACISLEELHFYATNLGQINFPSKFNNASLRILDLRYTGVKGGRHGSGGEEFVIHNETFEEAV